MKYLILMLLMLPIAMANTVLKKDDCSDDTCKYRKPTKKERCKKEAILNCRDKDDGTMDDKEMDLCIKNYAEDCEKKND